MPSPESKLIELSPRAQQDFVDILRYTAEKWGQNQFYSCRDKLDNALQTISHNPQLGRQREDLPASHRAYLVGSHVIIYRESKDRVSVVRILHQSMMLSRHIE